MEAQDECMVCFSKPKNLLPYQSIIQCTGCKAKAHQYCYCPTAINHRFLCDSCSAGFQGICYLCQNRGLLKRVGNSFAHPVCLLSNPGIMVDNFGKLTFMEVQNPKHGKKGKCSQCGKSTHNVLKCPLKCSKVCHFYCALKNRSGDDKGWHCTMSLCFYPNNYYQIFQNMMNRTIKSQNKFLAKSLNIPKNIKVISPPIYVYCQEHSGTIIQCQCKQFNEEQIDWVYCDSCCRWQHYTCIPLSVRSKRDLRNSQEPYYCQQCFDWKQNIESGDLEVLKQYPKMHIYDFIYIHHYMQIRRYKLSPAMLEFMLTLPILPGRQYAQSEYRQEIGRKAKAKINLAEIKKKLQSNGEKIDNVSSILMKYKSEIEFAWWIVTGKLVRSKTQKMGEQCFINCIDESTLQTSSIKMMIDTLIEFEHKYIGSTKSTILDTVKDKIVYPHDKRETNKLNSSIAYRDQRRSKSPKVQSKKVKGRGNDKEEINFKSICQSLKGIIQKCTINSNNFDLIDTLGQLRLLLTQPALLEYRDQLPKIPFVKSVLLFQDSKVSAEYLKSCSQIQLIKQQWEKFNGKFANRGSYDRIAKGNSLFAMRDSFLQERVTNCQHPQLRRQLLQEWIYLQVDNKVPNNRYSSNHEQIPLVINFSLVNRDYINRLISIYNRKLSQGNKPQIVRTMTTLRLTSIILHEFQTMQFQQKTYQRMRVRLQRIKAKNIEEKAGYQIPIKLHEQYVALYRQTESALSEKANVFTNSTVSTGNNPAQPDCLFTRLNRQKNHTHNKDDLLKRFIHYFMSIMDIRIDIFPPFVYEVLRNKFVLITDALSKRKMFFETEEEYEVVTKWMKVFKMDWKSITNIVDNDQAIQSQLWMKLNFDNPQTIEKLQTILEEGYKVYQSFNLEFRLKKIKVILTWINLYYMILQQMSPKSLLEPQFAAMLEDTNNKMEFYLMKQVWIVLNELKFPPCKFLQKLSSHVEKGEQICKKLDKITLLCAWSFEWQKTKQISDNKVEYDQCKQLEQQLRIQPFSFDVELIELEIVMKKYCEVENHAYLILIETKNQCNPQETQNNVKRIKELLTILGTLPIKSKYTHDLLQALSKFDKDDQSKSSQVIEMDRNTKLSPYLKKAEPHVNQALGVFYTIPAQLMNSKISDIINALEKALKDINAPRGSRSVSPKRA